MDKTIEYVMAGFLKLTKEQQSEFLAEIRKYNERTESDRLVVRKALLERIVSGPHSPGKCPCCSK